MKKLSQTSRDVLSAMRRGEQCCRHCAMLHEVLTHPHYPKGHPWDDERIDPGDAWVYLEDPRTVDYARSLRVQARTIALLRRESLIALDSERGGDVPMRWFVLTDAGRHAEEKE